MDRIGGRVTSPDPQATREFLRTHLGHEMKYLAFAAVEFSRPQARRYQVAIHDSALVRARSLIDFFRPGPTAKTVREKLFYATGVSPPAPDALGEKWFSFISGRISHIGRNRDATFDQWPDRLPGQDKGDDRLERLARFIADLIRRRAAYLRSDTRAVLELIADRAESYLNDPTEANFHAMDPANL